MAEDLEKKVFLVPIRIFNSKTSDPMGVGIWDWKHYVILAVRKINAVLSVMDRVKYDSTIELTGGKIRETSLEKAPYATPYGVVI